LASILIIDDDETILNVFQRFLSGKGHDVRVASDGRTGLRVLECGSVDLVITDIMMPEVDGLEVVMFIRSRGESIPVIAISGGMHALPMDFLPMARKFGAAQVLYKPVELSALLAAVNAALETD
jgi:two-component system response regulator HydG